MDRPPEIKPENYNRIMGSAFTECWYDMERTARLLFPLGKPFTPYAGFKDFYPWQKAAFKHFDDGRRQRRFQPGGPKVAPQRLTVGSGKGAGKTIFTAMWFWCLFATHPYAQAIMTAATETQLDDRLWKDVRDLHRVSEYLTRNFHVDSKHARHREYGGAWQATAIVPSQHKPETMQGMHSAYLTIAAGDEGSAIRNQDYDALDGIDGDPHAYHLYVSNPLSRSGTWHGRTYGPDREDWGHTKNYRNGEDPFVVDVSRLPEANVAEYERKRERFGYDSKKYRVEVRGLPPLSEDDTMFDPDTIRRRSEESLDTESGDPLADPEAPLVCGVDLPAGSADARFVAFFRKDYDARSIEPIVYKGRMNQRQIIQKLEYILNREWNGEEIRYMFLDQGNIGFSVYDELCAAGYRANLVPVNFQARSPDTSWANMRAYMYSELNDWMERGGRIPRIEALREELEAQRIDPRESREAKLIPKKEITKELGRSPDLSDALALTFAERRRTLGPRRAMGRSRFGRGGRPERVTTNWRH